MNDSAHNDAVLCDRIEIRELPDKATAVAQACTDVLNPDGAGTGIKQVDALA
ncbi:hypothetical protein GUG23_01380 [Xanthomonas citri pv. citri]|nr:hypothetical protein [Xanthomonas citri pv. citri]